MKQNSYLNVCMYSLQNMIVKRKQMTSRKLKAPYMKIILVCRKYSLVCWNTQWKDAKLRNATLSNNTVQWKISANVISKFYLNLSWQQKINTSCNIFYRIYFKFLIWEIHITHIKKINEYRVSEKSFAYNLCMHPLKQCENQRMNYFMELWFNNIR